MGLFEFLHNLLGPPPAPLPPAPPPILRRSEFTDQLPSRMAGVAFDVAITADWYLLGGTAAQGEAALRYCLLHAARGMTASAEVTALTLVEAELSYRLPLMNLTQSKIRLAGCAVSVTVQPEVRQVATLAEQLRRNLVVQQLEQQLEQAHLRYLREQVLSDPATARTYWFKHHPGSLDPLLGDQFERVAARLTSSGSPEIPAIAGVVHDFLSGLDEDERRYLMARLGDVFVSFDRGDLAARVLDR
ncbi:hypothetical protein ACIBF5_07260 [Micromonospora sp. NPDC050417]|uniref:hypothetical protein n=1 Tax=Micromonospora sp. NPDC050417 TaxID=3364280 RepID=UPI0037B1A1CD